MQSGTELARTLAAIADGTAAHNVESETLDFKTVGRSIKDTVIDLAEAAACFANSSGGTIIVGVKDEPGGSDAFVGSTLDVAAVRRAIFDQTDPHLTVDVSEVLQLDTKLTVIRVPEAAAVHTVRGKHTERIGTSCMPMSSGRIARVVADRSGDDCSAGPTGISVDQVDAIAMATARRFLEGAIDPTRRSWATLSDHDLLRVLGTTHTSGNRLFPDEGVGRPGASVRR